MQAHPVAPGGNTGILAVGGEGLRFRQRRLRGEHEALCDQHLNLPVYRRRHRVALSPKNRNPFQCFPVMAFATALSER